jgi:hypothetical protein
MIPVQNTPPLENKKGRLIFQGNSINKITFSHTQQSMD